MTLKEAVKNLLDKKVGQWRSLGYGKFACTSCGSFRYEDFDPPKISEQEEEHSRTCPWRLLKEAYESDV